MCIIPPTPWTPYDCSFFKAICSVINQHMAVFRTFSHCSSSQTCRGSVNLSMSSCSAFAERRSSLS
jgi:hypothetical protein